MSKWGWHDIKKHSSERNCSQLRSSLTCSWMEKHQWSKSCNKPTTFYCWVERRMEWQQSACFFCYFPPMGIFNHPVVGLAGGVKLLFFAPLFLVRPLESLHGTSNEHILPLWKQISSSHHGGNKNKICWTLLNRRRKQLETRLFVLQAPYTDTLSFKFSFSTVQTTLAIKTSNMHCHCLGDCLLAEENSKS